MRRLVIVCGVPGAGKSTFARHAVEHWGAVSFASETFAATLGEGARNASGDLSRDAIAYAYSAMERAVVEALATNPLVVAVGSFRSAEMRRRFRDIAPRVLASTTTLRIACPVTVAATRVLARVAQGERGPNEHTIGQIDAELDRAHDIDAVLHNDTSIDRFQERADALMSALIKASEVVK